jgi:hypothetical protein
MAQISNTDLDDLLEALVNLRNELAQINEDVFDRIGGAESPVSVSSVTVTSTSGIEQDVIDEIELVSSNLAWLATAANSLLSADTAVLQSATTEDNIEPPPSSGTSK